MKNEPINTSSKSASDKAYAREDLVYNVTEDILVLLEDLDVSKQELARRLGKSKSFVSQILSGARNMTLGTLSDICFVLDVTPQVVLPIGKAEAPVKQVKAAWEGCIPSEEDFMGSLQVSSTNVIQFPKNKNNWHQVA